MRIVRVGWNWGGVLPLLGLVAVLITPVPIVAQQGQITGQVVAAQNARPLSGAQVHIPASALGTLTRGNGRFLLTNVPAGEHTLRVEIIGFAAVERQVTVRAGETTALNFELQEVALALDEVVVTGTGAPTQRRRLGQTIATVSAEEFETAPVASVAQALVGRISGAHGLMSGGQTGAGSRIILRGTSSISQRQDPLIYIDGVRMENSRQDAGSVTTDQLSSINPNNIERIEVIKGAAAATLYGTEASSGVIQIFTKRGMVGEPIYTFSMDQQYLDFARPFEDNCAYDSENHEVVCNNPYSQEARTGYHQNYNLSVRGGTQGIQYFVSGRIMNEVNPSPNNELTNRSIRASFDFNHTDRLSSRVDLNLIDRRLQVAEPTWGDGFGNLMLGNPLIGTPTNKYGSFTPWGVTVHTESFLDQRNILASGRLAYEWTDNLRSTLQVGHNLTDTRHDTFFPQGMVAEEVTGTRDVTNRRRWTTTVDFNTSWETQVSDRLVGNVTVGGQSFWDGRISESGSVREFGSPTLKTLSAGSEITGVSESWEEVINAGVFAQGQIGIDDRLFITAGGRADGNSAFGEDFGLEFYPKAGVSWVVSEHDFWNVSSVNELRLRGAIGSSGLQPGAFDAQRTWEPDASVIGGYLTPDNVGNPELRPERSTEIELAVEAGMFDGRFGAQLVYFNQTTEDALLEVPNAPSTGFTGSQLRNVGILKSWGLELSMNMRVVERPGFTWDLGVSPTYLDQWVESLGGLADRRLGSRRRFHSLYEGMWPGIWIAPIVDPDQPYILSGPIEEITSRGDIIPNLLEAADGTDSLAVIGRPHPNWTVNMNTSFQIGENLTIRSLFEAAGGFIVSNETDHLRMALGNSPLVAQLEYVLADPNTTAEERFPLVDEYGRKHPGVLSNTMYVGDYLRWSEATVAYRLPEAWSLSFGADVTTVSLAVRNLHVFSSYFNDWKKGWQDPNTRGAEDDTFVSNVDYLKTPPLRRFVLSLQMQF